jgi:hypothetical protein
MMADHLTAEECREALHLAAKALEAIGTPPSRPYLSGSPDDEARIQQW